MNGDALKLAGMGVSAGRMAPTLGLKDVRPPLNQITTRSRRFQAWNDLPGTQNRTASQAPHMLSVVLMFARAGSQIAGGPRDHSNERPMINVRFHGGVLKRVLSSPASVRALGPHSSSGLVRDDAGVAARVIPGGG